MFPQWAISMGSWILCRHCKAAALASGPGGLQYCKAGPCQRGQVWSSPRLTEAKACRIICAGLQATLLWLFPNSFVKFCAFPWSLLGLPSTRSSLLPAQASRSAAECACPLHIAPWGRWKPGAGVQVGDPKGWPGSAQREGKTTFSPSSQLILFSVLPFVRKLGSVGQCWQESSGFLQLRLACPLPAFAFALLGDSPA